MCDGCYNLDREGCDSDTACTFRRVCVSPEEERGFLSVAQKQTWYVCNEQQPRRQMHKRRCVAHAKTTVLCYFRTSVPDTQVTTEVRCVAQVYYCLFHFKN